MKRIFLFALLPVLLAVPFFSDARPSAAEDVKDVLLTFAEDQRDRLPTRWYGGETFCVFENPAPPDSGPDLAAFVTGLNAAYGSDFKVVLSDTAAQCPSFTSFFIKFGRTSDRFDFNQLFLDLSGSRPNFDNDNLNSLNGFSISLPGSRNREFVYLNEGVAASPSNANPRHSIMLEEIAHAITGLDDFQTDRIISIFGENHDVPSYAAWFEANPTGLCFVDFYVLGIALDFIDNDLGASGLSGNGQEDANMRAIEAVIEQLPGYGDDRCT